MVRRSDNDHVTVIGAGVTLHEALAAAEVLAGEGKINTALWWSRVGTVGPYLHVCVNFIMNSCREKYSRD